MSETIARERERYKLKRHKRLASARQWYKLFKLGRACSVCGESDQRCLDFHHLDPSSKHRDVSTMILRGVSKQKIEDESKKCIVLCGNCHQKEHHSKER
jgi:hypothetical protein